MKTRVRGSLANLQDTLTQNVGYRLVSLFIALLLWVWVQSEQRVEDRVRAKVRWVLPPGMALVEPPIEQATLTVEGVQALVRSLNQRDLVIEVDLSRAEEGDVAVDLSQRKVNELPAQLNVLAIAPAQLRVTLDRMFKRKVSIAAATVGVPPEGYRVAAVTVEPSRAEIEGPVSVLRGLEKISTEDVDLGGLREDGDFEVGLKLRNGLSATAKGARFTVHVDIEAVVDQRTFLAVPVVMRRGDYVPETTAVEVVLTGPTDVIATLQPDQLSVMVYLPDGFAEPTAVVRRGKTDGPHFEVMHGAGDEVTVLDVEPGTLTIRQREAQ